MKTLYYGGGVLFAVSIYHACTSVGCDVRLLACCAGMIGGIAMHHIGVVLLNHKERST